MTLVHQSCFFLIWYGRSTATCKIALPACIRQFNYVAAWFSFAGCQDHDHRIARALAGPWQPQRGFSPASAIQFSIHSPMLRLFQGGATNPAPHRQPSTKVSSDCRGGLNKPWLQSWWRSWQNIWSIFGFLTLETLPNLPTWLDFADQYLRHGGVWVGSHNHLGVLLAGATFRIFQMESISSRALDFRDLLDFP